MDILPRDLNTPANQENQVRPTNFDDFIGQIDVVKNLRVFLEAARIRNEPLDHALFSGPPGLGKTTLSRIIATCQSGRFYQLAAPNLKRPGDIVKILSALEKNDTLFIDEIHRLPAPVEEVLYSAMEDGQIDIALADGLAAAPIQLDLPPFTLVGATTKPGNLTAPLRDRFGIHLRLDYYLEEDIIKILVNAASRWNIDYEADAIREIAQRSRKTPRVALRLLRRIWDFALTSGTNQSKITLGVVRNGFDDMHIDVLGLTALDNQFLRALAENFNGGPVGLKPVSATLSEDVTTLEDFIEPYMMRLDLIQRTPRGRILTRKGYEHIRITPESAEQGKLYE